MKLKFFAVAMAFVMAVALTGCFAGREESSSPVEPTNSVSSDSGSRASAVVGSDARNSAGVGSDARNSAGVDDIRNSADVGNDAAQGGGAGGTNDLDNDGVPDGSAGRSRAGVGRAVDDIGDAAGDLARGAGNAVRDVGDAVGDAVSDVGRAVR